MGCELSRLARPPPPPPAPPTAPGVPLTPRQVYLMLASWKGIARAMEPTGVHLFIKLFEENEELIGLFERFETLKTHELRQHSAELAEHATKVMHTLDAGLRSLGDAEVFDASVRAVGASHTRIPGFKAHYFWRVEAPFLAAARATLGDRYSDNVRDIYTAAIRHVVATLVRGFTDAAGDPAAGGDPAASSDPAAGGDPAASSDPAAVTTDPATNTLP
ncbi:neuroglobin-1 [Plutella xylostella]|uniref:neuroglobin-1 n=1 Tax=Plutella xylostella TaxID=51655 RepID=UPI00203236E7|nr:neuroglobin-1 [Plutella xylostella]